MIIPKSTAAKPTINRGCAGIKRNVIISLKIEHQTIGNRHTAACWCIDRNGDIRGIGAVDIVINGVGKSLITNEIIIGRIDKRAVIIDFKRTIVQHNGFAIGNRNAVNFRYNNRIIIRIAVIIEQAIRDRDSQRRFK